MIALLLLAPGSASARLDGGAVTAPCRNGCTFDVTLHASEKRLGADPERHEFQITARVRITIRAYGEGRHLALGGRARGDISVTLSQSPRFDCGEYRRTFRGHTDLQVGASIALNGAKPDPDALGNAARIELTSESPRREPDLDGPCHTGEGIGDVTDWCVVGCRIGGFRTCSQIRDPSTRCTQDVPPGVAQLEGIGFSTYLTYASKARQTLRTLRFPVNRLWAGQSFSLAGSRRADWAAGPSEETTFRMSFTRRR